MTTDELSEYGMEQMDDEAVRRFLSSQSIGVLGLPTDSAPALRPMSFWFDGDSQLYFPYLVGSNSRKANLSDQASIARFLVYRAETTFNWRSVLLTGPISKVSGDERVRLEESVEMNSQPDLLKRASTAENTGFYQLQIENQSGIKHLGLPPGLADDTAHGKDTNE
ncbi:pyridoxamine 5'-phosphate oxidase family protein [Halococcus thailandensis]|uniref:Flavin-nucleotide-binding protein-like protein n=1 Tax=Halococcus thailandensis JCM 13552 TaxID=1227457 RepID=M0NF08_9EURY|nr:pyridoxamine 5'-phosphate oxidase family protein [Halococcus thailandensis]EMA56138.1 hypothetical protein C451_03839 [Halococcus thailandensis JCM 13552]